TIGGDLYISIASLESNRAGLLLIVTPLVSWIWISVLLMAAGGFVALVQFRSVRGAMHIPRTAPAQVPRAARDDMGVA
ncbi:MAG TPA: cytochrome c-type biogenesis CcmF C-terminal domain-containing protein, partial [Thermoanaerobaculia bacterium]